MTSKTLYLRGIPEGLVRRAKVRAAEQGTTLSAVVASALERHLDSADAEPDPQIAALASDMDWYADDRDAVLRDHEGDYVAIVDHAVVDHDTAFAPLASRISERYGRRPVFITRCDREERPLRLRSPRVPRD